MWTEKSLRKGRGRAEGQSYKRSEAGAEATDENKSCSNGMSTPRITLPGPQSPSCGLRAGEAVMEMLTLHDCGLEVGCTGPG